MRWWFECPEGVRPDLDIRSGGGSALRSDAQRLHGKGRIVRVQFRTMRTQPRMSLSPIGAKLFDGGPELRSMIEVAEVAELVHDDVVKDVEGREH